MPTQNNAQAMWSPRSALITGGASGIGLATAQLLRRSGAEVVIADIATEGMSVADSNDLVYANLDVTDPGQWKATVANILEALGRLDLVHLNAGSQSISRGEEFGPDPLALVSPEKFARVVAINMGGVVNGLCAVRDLPDDVRPRDVIVTASTVGLVPAMADPLYGMTKHGVVGLVRSLAAPFAKLGVRLQAICPGLTDTPLVPGDARVPGRVFSSSDYVAGCVERALDEGESGDLWVASGGRDYWKYRFAPVP